MSLKIIKLPKLYVRLIAVVSAVMCILGGYSFAKRSFANSISIRGDVKEVADLAVDLGPSDPQTHYFAALMYDNSFNESDLARSLDEYQKSVALLPNNYVLWLSLGKALEGNGDNDASEAAIKKALELAPNYAVVHWAYGNALLRHGKTADGFAEIAIAAASDPQYSGPAAATAWQLFDGDAAKVRQALGDSPEVNSALVGTFLGQKQFDDALEAWSKLLPEDKKSKFKSLGDTLIVQLIAAKKFRMAAKASADMVDNGIAKPVLGQINNGGFESEIKLQNAGTFEWQIGDGADPQIGLNNEQPHGGVYSLFAKFNGAPAAVMRQVSLMVAVNPSKNYSLAGFYRAELNGAVAWEIMDASDSKSLAKSAAIQSAASWSDFRADFKVPEGSDGIVIRLIKEPCTSGACTVAGKIWFDDLSLVPRDTATK